MKLVLIERRDWEQNGFVGSTIVGIKSDGKFLDFTTTRELADELELVDAVEYSEADAVEVPLRLKVFKGTGRYQHADAVWPKVEE